MSLKLTCRKYDEHLKLNEDDMPLDDVSMYRRLIEKLLYLTITRPDICFVVQSLSQYIQDPKVSHLEDAVRVARYIKREQGKSIYCLVSQHLVLLVTAILIGPVA